MSQSSSRSESRKRDYASSTSRSSFTGKTKTTTPYSAEFEQKLIDRGVYPDGYRTKDGAKPPKPRNTQEIRDVLSQARPSLSPSKVTEEVFEEFQDNNRRAESESTAMVDVIPTITGVKDREYETMGETLFNNLAKFDPELSVPKPDKYYGARTSQIDERVRNDLDEYVVPSTSKHRPTAPNYFFEGKGATGRPDVAQRQAMYDGAVGARAMLQLQNYGKPRLEYDECAYTLSTTYSHGQLKLYTTHPRRSACGRTDYYMTQLGAYAMTHSPETFRSGATAFRNARDWTQQQRDRLITDANAAARNESIRRQSASQTESVMEASCASAGNSFNSSETSADELALDCDPVAKRQKPASSP